ncbi:hypothetical protein MUG87_03000 [Ectobacillus sp. JY-23]|uniref:hypothetical protein n=1 Tax=Ectobacillus sp. JY-23 TaxID=2933872 RepID=UPI001FF29E0A|nr:hypothetical protein [Ectobacillus sp. JY-23]UOY93119.1 hypothetical protein MUG87_03000 [Ectobacillus sp. JY-23]
MEKVQFYMRRYGKMYLNEGHLVQALVTKDVLQINDNDKNIMLTIGASARDMIVYLGDYEFPAHVTQVYELVAHDELEEQSRRHSLLSSVMLSV